MDRRPMHLALREMQATFTAPRLLIGMAAITLVLAVSGPFNTFAVFNPAERLVYWLIVVIATYGVGRGAAALLLATIGARIASPIWRNVLAGAATGIPVTLIVVAINLVAFGGTTGIDPLLLWLSCTAISVVVMVINLLVSSPGTAAGAPVVAATPTSPTPPLFDRIPHPQRGGLIAMTVQDHYVEVVTTKGKTLLLLRLSDAIREVAPVAGVQIHRSHWVALDAVQRVTRVNGKMAVLLSNGQQLPISRGYLPEVRAAGLVV